MEPATAAALEIITRTEAEGMHAPPTASMPSTGMLDRLMFISNALARSGMPLPKNCRTPEAIFGKLLFGAEHGLSPMISLNQVHNIEGRLSLPAELKVALVRRRGLGEIDIVAATDERAEARVHRSDWPTDRWETVTFTIQDAAQAGLCARDVWRKYPRSMLLHRLEDLCCHLYFQHAGLPNSPDELGADVDESGTPIAVFDSPSPSTAPAIPTGIAPDAPVSPPTVESPAPIVPPAAPSANGTPAPPPAPSPEQVERARALVRQLKIGPAEWRTIITRFGGASIQEFTPDQADTLIGHLESLERLRAARAHLMAAGSLTTQQWMAALTRRGVHVDYQLAPADVSTIYQRLLDLLTPFDREKLGLDPPATSDPTSSLGNAPSPAGATPLSPSAVEALLPASLIPDPPKVPAAFAA